MSDADKLFAGPIPKIYQTLLVPLLFEPYAQDLVSRLTDRRLDSVLEIAAGTGVVTRALAARLSESVSIVATDLNPAMLEQAAALGTERAVEWRQADAMALPFADETFDAMICQFGAMFFPDKPRAFAEVRRVLKPGGAFLFNVWDQIEENEFADTVTNTLGEIYTTDPPRFMARTPHGYFDQQMIQRDLASSGFAKRASIETVAKRSRAQSPAEVATAYCQGTPLRNEIEARDATRLNEVTDIVAQSIERRFGSGPVDGKMQALVVSVES